MDLTLGPLRGSDYSSVTACEDIGLTIKFG